MRSALLGSVIVHGALTAAIFAVRSGPTVLVPGPDVVQVALVDASLAALPPAPEPVPAERAPDRVAPAEDAGVRLEKTPRRPEARRPQPDVRQVAKPDRDVAPASRVVLPYAAAGAGLSGQVAVDASNFEFAYYLQRVRMMIAANWSAPAGVTAGTRAEVYFRIGRDGSLSTPQVETGSGNAYFDQAALRAVIVTGHLPPLPMGWAGSELGVHFGFEYTGS